MNDTVRMIFHRIGDLRITRLLTRKYQARMLFLMYHRVIPDSDFINDTGRISELSVSVSLFDEQLSYISKNYHPISIDQVTSLPSDTYSFPKIPVVVTFDDGYKDNLVYALPILRKYKVPATIYITTRFPEGDCSIWWFELWEIVKARKQLCFVWRDHAYQMPLETSSQKLKGFNKIKKLLLSSTEHEKNTLLRKIRNGTPTKDYQEYVLNWGEIKELDKEELITIGAHTHTHPNLRNLNDTEAIQEMLTSKMLLERNLSHSVKHFAYPYGTPCEVGQREYNIAKKCGFETAVTAICRTFRENKLMEIPRVPMSNDDSNRNLDSKLSGWYILWKGNVLPGFGIY